MSNKIVLLILTTLTTFVMNNSTLIAKSQTTRNCFMQGNNGELLNLVLVPLPGKSASIINSELD